MHTSDIISEEHCHEIENIASIFTNQYAPFEYRGNLVPLPYEFRYMWHWTIWDDMGDVIIDREYYYEENNYWPFNEHNLICVDETGVLVSSG